LHAYLYCLNDPINRTDPAGRKSGTLVEQLGAAALHTQLYGADATAKLGGGAYLMKMLSRALTQYYATLNYATQAMRRGKAAERAVMDAFRLANTQVRQIMASGRIRIVDAIVNSTFIEIKNRGALYLTQQLKDLLKLALAEEGNLAIIIRAGTYISGPLSEWAEANNVMFYPILPSLGG